MKKKDSPFLWCIYHIPSQRGFEGLLYDEVRAIATVNMPNEWLVWKEGWPDWRPMNDHEGFEEPLARPLSIASPPAIPETLIGSTPSINTNTNVTPIKASTDITSVEIDAEDSEPSFIADMSESIDLVNKAVPYKNVNFVHRKNERFLKRYEVRVHYEGQEFITHSIDVSVGGIKTEDPLPDWVGDQFKVRIKKGKSQIELLAFRIQTTKDERANYRFGFLPLKNQQDESNLESWLKAS